jgi:hypothetical protein
MLPRISIVLWRTGRFSAMHPTSTVSHRTVPTWLPGSPRVGSASRALVHRSSDPEKPPKLCVYFDESGLIEYLVDKAAAKLPNGKSFVILPEG